MMLITDLSGSHSNNFINVKHLQQHVIRVRRCGISTFFNVWWRRFKHSSDSKRHSPEIACHSNSVGAELRQLLLIVRSWKESSCMFPVEYSLMMAMRELKLPMLKHSWATSMKNSMIRARCFFFTGCNERTQQEVNQRLLSHNFNLNYFLKIHVFGA